MTSVEASKLIPQMLCRCTEHHDPTSVSPTHAHVAIADFRRKNSKKLRLNIGGKVFATTVETLTRVQPSFFAAMFSGQYDTVRAACLFLEFRFQPSTDTSNINFFWRPLMKMVNFSSIVPTSTLIEFWIFFARIKSSFLKVNFSYENFSWRASTMVRLVTNPCAIEFFANNRFCILKEYNH